MNKIRCGWVGNDPLMIDYHDTEWGVPVHDDRKLFEYMILDAFQAGLSWRIVLGKRVGMEKAFYNFEPKKVAQFGDSDIDRLVHNQDIIRNRQKIHASIVNAQKFIEVQKELGSFDKYIWQFVGGKPMLNNWQTDDQIPAKSDQAEQMSKDLIARGFKFVGPTICYAFAQAAGLVNDHLVACFRHEACKKSD